MSSQCCSWCSVKCIRLCKSCGSNGWICSQKGRNGILLFSHWCNGYASSRQKKHSDIADQIQNLEDQFFEHDITQFIRELRNNLSHKSVVIPQWQIIFQPTGKTGSMMYPKNELLATGRWNKRSQKHVSSAQGKSLCIVTVIGEYNIPLEKFY